MTRAIWTVGHSNHQLDTFLGLLSATRIGLVADVRRFPGSRRHPQFQSEALERELAQAGIGYHHFEALGGRRSARAPDSSNSAWRVTAFNAFADHMETPEFRAALSELERLAGETNAAIMCAEALPWQCHRRLIADALVVRGWSVWDIMAGGKVEGHRLTEFARVVDGHLTYPASPLFGPSDRSSRKHGFIEGG
jgi:uncharacterized protein (DUF488 family)